MPPRIERHLIWAELDSNAPERGATRRCSSIRARTSLEGHRYIVALRNLKNAGGNTLKAPSWFQKLRDHQKLPPAEQPQRKRYESMFKSLDQAGIKRGNLYVAWDFTVMSRQSLSARMLKIRDDAFSQLGDNNLSDNDRRRQRPPVHGGQRHPEPGGRGS